MRAFFFDRPMLADSLSTEGGGQQELADEIGDFARCVPKAGGGVLSWAISMAPAAAAASSKVFLTVHGIDGQHSLLEAELAQESLDRRDFVGHLVAPALRQHRAGPGAKTPRMCAWRRNKQRPTDPRLF
jgi:hypothetical protein